MGAQLLATTAIILDRSSAAETLVRCTAICPEHGILTCMQRLSRKGPGKTPMLDLFDEARIDLESSNQGRTWFVRDALPMVKRATLGHSYETLVHACRLARILADNPVHEESRVEIFALLRRALDAWEMGGRADAIYFKSLYLLAQNEGYPVREDWRARLGIEDQNTARAILSEPAASQTTPQVDVQRLAHVLEEYLRHETPLHISAPEVRGRGSGVSDQGPGVDGQG